MKPFLLSAALASITTTVSHAALVAQWDFEEGSGTTTTETVSSTVTDAFGTGVSWSTDTPGTASTYSLSYPGTSAGNVRTNLDAATVGISGTGAKTITGWIKSGDTAGITRMFFGWSPTNGTGAGNDLRIGIDGSGFLRLEVSSGFALYNNVALDDNVWHMVGLVMDASENTQTVQFYIDGNLVNPTSSGARAINTSGTSADSSRDDIYLGIGNPQGTQQWAGLLDDVRIYNSALDDTALDGIYSAIPEPAAALLGGLGLLTLLRRRR